MGNISDYETHIYNYPLLAKINAASSQAFGWSVSQPAIHQTVGTFSNLYSLEGYY